MRLWSLHPMYLDRQGLTALWREALLAQRVLGGATRGYRGHPQLTRFRSAPDPAESIAAYLRAVHDEAARRGYRFDATRIVGSGEAPPLDVALDQLLFEWRHLLGKLRVRSPMLATDLVKVDVPMPHPLFRPVPGPVEIWERGALPEWRERP